MYNIKYNKIKRNAKDTYKPLQREAYKLMWSLCAILSFKKFRHIGFHVRLMFYQIKKPLTSQQSRPRPRPRPPLTSWSRNRRRLTLRRQFLRFWKAFGKARKHYLASTWDFPSWILTFLTLSRLPNRKQVGFSSLPTQIQSPLAPNPAPSQQGFQWEGRAASEELHSQRFLDPNPRTPAYGRISQTHVGVHEFLIHAGIYRRVCRWLERSMSPCPSVVVRETSGVEFERCRLCRGFRFERWGLIRLGFNL